MKVYIASDHRGFEIKNEIRAYLETSGYNVEDIGPVVYDKDDDYPDFAIPLAEKVVAEKAMGILLCNNGAGVTIAANKVKGARAAYIEAKEHAITSRQDDDANIMILDVLTFDPEKDFEIIETWLNTEFSGEERHVRRIRKIEEYEDRG